jgi:hypothetical protein
MVIIGRYINGITINPLEYLLAKGGEVMEFVNEGAAIGFFNNKGYSNDDIDGLVLETDNKARVCQC